MKNPINKGLESSLGMAERLIIGHESFRGRPYDDATGKPIRAPRGNVTLGYGRNTDANPLTEDEARFLLRRQLKDIFYHLFIDAPLFERLSAPRQAALVDIAYNVGYAGLLGFERMWAALQASDWGAAGREILDSDAGRQLPVRYSTLALIMVNDQMPGRRKPGN